ncbi:DivIVA domain-containing protein, partial [Streptomyces murinus]|uniref:DivIVA domain-containing protein n=1 Tax=Streptomyces murinus TaxID=33900 RepID=UPI00117EFF67
MPPDGFATGRGRGYRPAQVDAYLEALSADRDAAWERAARPPPPCPWPARSAAR